MSLDSLVLRPYILNLPGFTTFSTEVSRGMKRLLRHCLPIVSAGLLLTLPAAAQNAPSTSPSGGMQNGMPMQGGPGGQRTPPKPKNLKVLPPDVNILKVMRGYEQALGVECGFCHAAADPVTHRSDKASDANPV